MSPSHPFPSGSSAQFPSDESEWSLLQNGIWKKVGSSLYPDVGARMWQPLSLADILLRAQSRSNDKKRDAVAIKHSKTFKNV